MIKRFLVFTFVIGLGFLCKPYLLYAEDTIDNNIASMFIEQYTDRSYSDTKILNNVYKRSSKDTVLEELYGNFILESLHDYISDTQPYIYRNHYEDFDLRNDLLNNIEHNIPIIVKMNPFILNNSNYEDYITLNGFIGDRDSYSYVVYSDSNKNHSGLFKSDVDTMDTNINLHHIYNYSYIIR